TNLDRWDWIVVTSPRAAEALGMPPGTGTPPRIAAVGPQSATALKSFGWPVVLSSVGPGVLNLGLAMTLLHRLDGSRVLFPAGSRADNTLEETLGAAGARVTRVEAYRTLVTPPVRGCIVSDLARGVDAVTFASPSAVKGLDLALKHDLATVLGGTPAVAIGPTTAGPLRKSGVASVLVARTPGISAMVDAVCEISQLRRD
ncbi:MAG: uroporphyrinogen-III synthase, partial [Gemmatimonadales bacterium]